MVKLDSDSVHPTVDVIIPTSGRRDRSLNEAIASVLTQDYPGRIQILVVFDTGEREGWPTRQSEGRNRSQSSTHTPRIGPAGARNRGVVLTQAPLIAFVDDDDLWEPTKVSRQVELLQSNPRIGMVGTGLAIVTPANAHTTTRRPPRIVEHADLLLQRIPELTPSSVMIRRECFEEVGGFDESLCGGYAEDYDLFLRVSRVTQVENVLSAETVMRWHGDSHYREAHETKVTALKQLLEKHPEFASCPKGRGRVLAQIAYSLARVGHRKSALHVCAEALRLSPREVRAWASISVAAIPSVGPILETYLGRRGKSIA